MPAENAPRTVEEATRRIERARSEIDAATAPRPAPEAPSAPAGAPTDMKPQSASPTSDTPSSYGTPCSSPCRALGSMRRSVEALCDLTGPEDSRCVEAKKTLAESRTKVGPCTCE